MRASHRRSRVRTDVAAFPPRQVQAPDELQVEGVAAVQHGEAHNVGLIVHHVVQPKQREVLAERGGKRRYTFNRHVTCVHNWLKKQEL